METTTLTYREPDGTQPVRLPLSKSIAARLMVIATLGGHDPAPLVAGEEPLCDDLEVMLRATQTILSLKDTGGEAVIDLHDSGTAKRLLTALCACTPGLRATLRQSSRLAERPLGVKDKILSILSSGVVKVNEDDTISIKGGEYIGLDLRLNIDTTRSSQACSALMLVAPGGSSPTELCISPRGVSTPYIGMTASLMERCGATVRFDPRAYTVRVIPSSYREPDTSLLEADWSAAAFFYLWSALSGLPLEINGLKAPGESVQGDSAAARYFEALGVKTEVRDGGIRLTPGGVRAKSLDILLRECPDLVPPLAVACAMTGTPFLFRGISHLRYKESDRLASVSEALKLFGLKVNIGADSLEWTGNQTPRLPAEPIKTCNDHRIAMSFAMTAVRFSGVRLDSLDCADKSFPAFREQIQRLGVFIS